MRTLISVQLYYGTSVAAEIRHLSGDDVVAKVNAQTDSLSRQVDSQLCHPAFYGGNIQ